MFHSLESLASNHKPHFKEYANEAARLADTGLAETDVKKVALQLDTNALWLLTDTTPTWATVASGPGSGTVTSVAAGDGLDFTTITTTGPVTMGTPGTTTGASTNAVTSTSHTHAATLVTDDVTESTDKNYVTDAEAVVIGNTSGTNTGDQSAGDFNHDDLANITGTAAQYNHPTDANMVVLGNTSGTNTGDQDISGLALKSNVLELDNTDAFTPDADYEPATKKYVDDNAGGGAVDSVNTQTGTVVLDADDISDAATTNKYTTAGDISKLAGIETAADVTDSTNVNAAGATMNADTTMAGNGYFLDDDTMAGDDNTKVASQQSIKAYVDNATPTTFWQRNATNLTPTTSGDDIGATADRINKIWATDMTITNAIAGDITGNAGTVTTITGLAPDTATTAAAQANITSVGTLTSLLVSGDIGLTGTRVTKGWFTDLQVTNAIAGDITGNAATVTTIAGLAPNTATTAAAQANITSLGTLTGLTMGGDVTLGENSIELDESLSADGKYSGTTIDGTAGATLAFGDVVYIDPTDSKWELTDANADEEADGDARGSIGICVLAASADAATKILINGVVRADTAFPTLTVNAQVYVSETAGDLTNTAPVTADNVVRVLGYGISANEMIVNPSPDYITIT